MPFSDVHAGYQPLDDARSHKLSVAALAAVALTAGIGCGLAFIGTSTTGATELYAATAVQPTTGAVPAAPVPVSRMGPQTGAAPAAFVRRQGPLRNQMADEVQPIYVAAPSAVSQAAPSAAWWLVACWPVAAIVGYALARRSPQSLAVAIAATSGDKVVKTDAEWRAALDPLAYNVLRKKGTERPHTGKYDKFYPKEGYFVCAGCGNPLYSAASKFDSGCGWPAFDKCYEGSIKTEIDSSLFMRRVEILCNKCDGHLGHVFENEGLTPTMERHCVNSVSVDFVPEGNPPGVSESPLMKGK